MKKKRKKGGMIFVGIIGVLILIIVLLVFLIKEKSTNDNYSDNSEITATEEFIDYEALEIKEYEYPAEFSMGDNLKTAITELALCYDSFDKDSVYSAEWKEMFIDRFIQNSRVSFDYLDMVSDNNNGEIGIDELNYMQYSLTGIELDFSSYVNGTINRYDDSSTLNYGWISDWDYEYTDDGVTVTVNFEAGTDGTDFMQERELTVNLIKNPYSCFDGYSVAAITLLDYNAAYSDYLEHNKLYDDLSAGTYKNSTGQIVYSLEYIDNDEIPELVFGRTNQQVQASCYILTYKNGDVKCVGPIGPYNGFSFYEKKNMIIENTVIEGYSVYSYLVLKEDGSLENVGEVWLSESLDNQEEIYYINDNQVSKEEFYESVATADSSECINWNSADNSNNYTLLSDKTIEKIKNMK